ncbi:succinylglutamate-semialdehyde dehydrogenase [Thorsellia anophelis]|uniref:N-succinylglutamate 5-semialdehyde dehydrogenase n=1 Tax=Thorsellia anophelis DSM 18579 TaxID=1123402 RepID=A0A1I0C0Y3_9GAMM|nr:succinylglutamate-semialdehyde dehydrogenase [Thorsellia anophelis]SET12395.1 succinylglutamic semialdehyde dehydrogenase [Thorsellia anophelis DSM 18579]
MSKLIFNSERADILNTGMSLYIDGQWQVGKGERLSKADPYYQKLIWEGTTADESDVNFAVESAAKASSIWFSKGLEYRINKIKEYALVLSEHKNELSKVISKETGKPYWETLTEVQAMIGKISISIDAYHNRTPTKETETGVEGTYLTHKPHGVMAVFGPYNFPGHLPNGHIIPALIAGNTIVFKPSEQTPWTAECLVKLFEAAGMDKGVINLVQGAKSTGISLSAHSKVNGILFTGSAQTGIALHKQLAGQVDKMLALEMGGNNALVVEDFEDLDAAVHVALQSAFLSAGQRCTCARRLLIKKGIQGDRFLARLIELTKQLTIGAWDSIPEPFMGTVISDAAAEKLLEAQDAMVASGANLLLKMTRINGVSALISPGIVEATGMTLPDEEYFGPLLTVYRYSDLQEAVILANKTRFGLSAGLISINSTNFDYFKMNILAGVVNFNKPLTGASSHAPFGGVGLSGNHRPSAYYAADYCAWPMASMATRHLSLPESFAPGLPFTQYNKNQ